MASLGNPHEPPTERAPLTRIERVGLRVKGDLRNQQAVVKTAIAEWLRRVWAPGDGRPHWINGHSHFATEDVACAEDAAEPRTNPKQPEDPELLTGL